MINKIQIQNFRVFKDIVVSFDDGMNLIVGDNDSGKSTLLEAIHLVLTKRVGRTWFDTELSPHYFNRSATDEYVAAAAQGRSPTLPEIVIDLYLSDDDEFASLKGKNNLLFEDAPGLRVRAFFDGAFADAYEQFLATGSISMIPTEYYRVEWKSFADQPVTAREIPVAASVIDASTIRLQSGVDYHVQRIISGHLEDKERAELARAYRSLQEVFAETPSVKQVNEKLRNTRIGASSRELSIAVDVSSSAAWDRSLVPHFDELPFQLIGKGAQSSLKVLLALRRAVEASHVVLIEEPENHLSPASLSQLLKQIEVECEGSQVIATTHSSFVLNKLGLSDLILLNDQSTLRLTNLPEDTLNYFKKLPGYDTLRLVLAERAILVEGPSDELVLQRAYLDAYGKMPLDDGIEVICIRGLSCKRFLDIAKPLEKRVAAVVDNDGKSKDQIEASFSNYIDVDFIEVHFGDAADGNTLEPQIASANDLDVLNGIFGTEYGDKEALSAYMSRRKTECALKIFESAQKIEMPRYLRKAIGAE